MPYKRHRRCRLTINVARRKRQLSGKSEPQQAMPMDTYSSDMDTRHLRVSYTVIRSTLQATGSYYSSEAADTAFHCRCEHGSNSQHLTAITSTVPSADQYLLPGNHRRNTRNRNRCLAQSLALLVTKKP